MSIFVYQLGGLIFAILLQFGVCGLAVKVARIKFAYSYLLVVFVASALLSLQAFIGGVALLGLLLLPGIFWLLRSPQITVLRSGGSFKRFKVWITRFTTLNGE